MLVFRKKKHTFAVILQANDTSMRFITIIFALLIASNAAAQKDSSRVFSVEEPLVYVDAKDWWPYAFLDEAGEPDGYNIELVRLLLNELHIPYIIKLKPRQEVMEDMKTGRADLTIGLASGFYDSYSLFGNNVIVMLTQSVATPKSKTVEIKTFRDLGRSGTKVMVGENSFCHRLMTDYGWADQAIVINGIKQNLQQLSANEDGQIVSNTLLLKWLIKDLKLENIELTPVDMPHGTLKFMANNQKLLNRLDKTYAQLYATDELEPLERKWFYPEAEEEKIPEWVWTLAALAVVLLLCAIVYSIYCRIKDLRVTATDKKLNRRLALIIETCKVSIWTYDVASDTFAWLDEKGEVTHTYAPSEFANCYYMGDFSKLKDALDRLISQNIDARGHEEEKVKLELRATGEEDGDGSIHTFVVVVSVLNRDKNGKPTVIIGTRRDVTKAREMQKIEADRSLRYWSIFYSPAVAVIFFDKEGYMANASPKACELYEFDIDEMVRQRVHMNDFFNLVFTDLRDTNGFESAKNVGGRTIKYRMASVCNDKNELIGVFIFSKAL